MFSPSNNNIIYLNQGDLYFSNKPAVVRTILGSCVSATFYNERTRYAGIIHAMFPEYKENSEGNPLLYVDYGIRKLMELFLSKMIVPDEIEIKLFGGGDVIKSTIEEKSVGDRNVITALNTLKDLNVTASSIDVRKEYGRLLYFHTQSGKIYLKKFATYNSEQNK